MGNPWRVTGSTQHGYGYRDWFSNTSALKQAQDHPNGEELSEIWVKWCGLMIWSYLSQYLTVLDDPRLVLTGKPVRVHGFNLWRVRVQVGSEIPTGLPALCPTHAPRSPHVLPLAHISRGTFLPAPLPSTSPPSHLMGRWQPHTHLLSVPVPQACSPLPSIMVAHLGTGTLLPTTSHVIPQALMLAPIGAGTLFSSPVVSPWYWHPPSQPHHLCVHLCPHWHSPTHLCCFPSHLTCLPCHWHAPSLSHHSSWCQYPPPPLSSQPSCLLLLSLALWPTFLALWSPQPSPFTISQSLLSLMLPLGILRVITLLSSWCPHPLSPPPYYLGPPLSFSLTPIAIPALAAYVTSPSFAVTYPD